MKVKENIINDISSQRKGEKIVVAIKKKPFILKCKNLLMKGDKLMAAITIRDTS